MSLGSIPFSVMCFACIGGSPYFDCLSRLMYPGSRVKKNILLDYGFVPLKCSPHSKLVRRAAAYKTDHFHQTLSGMSKEAFLIDVLEIENTH